MHVGFRRFVTWSIAGLFLIGGASCATVGGMLGLGERTITIEGQNRDDVRAMFFIVHKESDLPRKVDTATSVRELVDPDMVDKYDVFVQLLGRATPEGSWVWEVISSTGKSINFIETDADDEAPIVEFMLDTGKLDKVGPFAAIVAVHGKDAYYARLLSHASLMEGEDVELQTSKDSFVIVSL